MGGNFRRSKSGHNSTPVAFLCYDGNNGSDSISCPGIPSKGQLTAIQQVDDQGLFVSTKFSYASFGALAAVNPPSHAGALYFYDQTLHLFPEQICNALNECSTLAWDKVLGKISSVTDPNNVVSSEDFDAFGRVIKVTMPNGAVLHRDYVDSGNAKLQHIHDQIDDKSKGGQWTDSYYDGLGRTYKVIQKGDAPGSNYEKDRVYSDASTRVYRESDWYRNGKPTNPTLRAILPADNYKAVWETFAYDAAGRLTTLTHADSTFLKWKYDSDGTFASVTSADERGHTKEVDVDAYARPSRIVEPVNGQLAVTTYTYDALNRPRTATDAMGNVTTITWNMLSQRTAVSDPNMRTWRTTFDLGGNVKTTTDAKNNTITFFYDAIGRMNERLYPNGSKVTWNYDEPGHGSGIGRLTSIIDSSSSGCPSGDSDQISYGSSGRVTSWTKCIMQTAYTTGFSYDAVGRDQSITYPDGEKVTYKYDASGRLSSMPGYLNSNIYDAAGRPLRTTYANGVVTNFKYDYSRGWLQNTKATSGATSIYDMAYRYYPNGLTQNTSSGTNKSSMTYEYDGLDRLSVVKGDVSQSFQYDLVGDMTLNSKVGTYTYPVSGPTGCSIGGVSVPCDKPQAVTTAGQESWTYDENGALSSATNATTNKSEGIDWNYDHKPTVISDFDGNITNYGYDAATNLVSVQTSAETLMQYGPLFDYSNARGLIKRYFAEGGLVARNESGATYWYHNDERDSTRAITDANGAVVGRFDYDPFGAIATSPTPTNASEFAGHAVGSNSRLVYMNARFYDSTIGRFISPDSMVPNPLFSQALNRYAYAYDSPISYSDPSGHQPYDVSTSYQEDPPPITTFDIWAPEAPFGTTGTATGGWSAGQICSACHGAKQIYATAPFATLTPIQAPMTRKDLLKLLAGVGFDRDAIQEAVPNVTVGELEDLNIDVVTGKVREEEYNFGVDMFGKFTGLLALEVSGRAIYNPALEMALGTEATTAGLAVRSRGSIYGPTFKIGQTPPAGHNLIVKHLNAEGELVAEWEEVSGQMLRPFWRSKSFPSKMYLTHTEVKALTRILPELKEGDTLIFTGFRPICTSGMCDWFMHTSSLGSRANIFYYVEDGEQFYLQRYYLGGVGRILP